MALIDSFSRFLYNCKNLFATKGEVSTITEKIPTQASAQNQLADKNFVNSSIQTATATFRGNYGTWDEALNFLEYNIDNNDYIVVRDASGYAPMFIVGGPDGVGYVFGDVIFYEDDLGLFGLFKCVVGSTHDTPTRAPNDWEQTTSNPHYKGTWRFKYAGNGHYNKKNWKAEYQINEEPLTAAQVAALNSNITEELTNKLQSLPAKPVDTAAQVLSAAEQAQVRTNIGATAPEIFWATYGTTTYQQIVDAYTAEKMVMCLYNGHAYSLTNVVKQYAGFSAYYDKLAYLVRVTNADVWSAETNSLQSTYDRVYSWSATTDNNRYPSEKLVYDSLGKRGIIHQTQNWTHASDGGYDYEMSEQVWGLVPQANIDLFTSAGAVFNENTGYFELNGLTDLSYEEMQEVYKTSSLLTFSINKSYCAIKLNARTVLSPVKRFNDVKVTTVYNWAFYDSNVEILSIVEQVSSLSQAFRVARFLRDIGEVDVSGISTSGAINNFALAAYSLETAKLKSLNVPVVFSNSPRLSLESVVFIVENASNTSVISITLHATAYARCVADTTEYTYQGNTYTGIVALANAKQITIASA